MCDYYIALLNHNVNECFIKIISTVYSFDWLNPIHYFIIQTHIRVDTPGIKKVNDDSSTSYIHGYSDSTAV